MINNLSFFETKIGKKKLPQIMNLYLHLKRNMIDKVQPNICKDFLL